MIPIVTCSGWTSGAVDAAVGDPDRDGVQPQWLGLYAGQAIGKLDLPPLMAVTMFGAFFIVPVQRDRRHPLRVPRPEDRLGRRPRHRIRCSACRTCEFSSPPTAGRFGPSTVNRFDLSAPGGSSSSASRLLAKSVTAQTLIRPEPAPPNATITGSVMFDRRDLNILPDNGIPRRCVARGSRWCSGPDDL